ncbi:MAG: hypothetical protein ACXVA9_05520 [Bdellovibrionales bacterium]
MIRDASLDDFSLVDALSERFPGVNERSNPEGLFIFESEILDLYRAPAAERNFDELARRWNFDPDEAFDIFVYYGTRIFSEEEQTPEAVFNRLRELSKQRFIREHQDEYDYLRLSVTHLSVPEMATERGATQWEIYNRLILFGISIVESFNRKVLPEQATQLREGLKRRSFGYFIDKVEDSLGALDQLIRIDRAGVPTTAVFSLGAEVFGFGEQALEFVYHHVREQNRGVEWTRVAQFDGSEMTEVEILCRLFEAGLTHTEIAYKLNRLFPRGELRTQGSVQSKLRALGMHRHSYTKLTELYLPEYGYLIKSGRFIKPLIFRFLADHTDKSLDWLATQLGTSVDSIKRFMERYHIDFMGETKLGGRLARSMSNYVRQMGVLRKTLNWINDPARGNGRTPALIEIRDISGVSNLELVSEAIYEGRGVFESSSELFLRLKAFAQREGVSMSLAPVNLRYPSDRFREVRRNDILREFFDFVNSYPVTSGKRLQIRTDDSPIGYQWLTTTYYPSPIEFWKDYKKYSESRNVDFSLLNVTFRAYTPEIRELMKQEALDLITRWIVTHDNHLPPRAAFGSEIPINEDFLKGIKGGVNAHRRIFDSPQDYFKAIKRYTSERGIPVSLIQERFTAFDDDLRGILQDEALTILADWIADPLAGNGRMPTGRLLAEHPTKVPLSWRRLAAVNDYREGDKNWGSRIFDSPEDLWKKLKKRIGDHCAEALERGDRT